MFVSLKRALLLPLLCLFYSAGAVAVTATLPNAVLPFDMPSMSELRASPKKVFAHYFTQFPLSIDNQDPQQDYYTTQYLAPSGEGGKHQGYGGFLRERPLSQPSVEGGNWFRKNYEEEIRRAAAIGLDGFSVDMLSYEGTHWNRLVSMLDAAQSVDPGFKILLMPDMNAGYAAHPEKLADSIRTLASHPAAYRQPDGRLVVSPYNAQNRSVAWWTAWLAEMKASGVDISFVPLFQGWNNYAQAFAPISDGFSDWGWRTPEQASWRNVPSQVHQYVPIWMAPVAPQDMRPSSRVFWEAGNSETFRVMWENAILGGADWVQLITWNDYSEHAEVAPSSGTQFGFYDLAAYYISYFKNGQAPTLRRDALYYFHRSHSTTAQPAKQTQLANSGGGASPRNQIELLAFLVAPGTLEIEINGQTHRRDAPAGMTSFRVPLAEGRPTFRLLRGASQIINLSSAFPISNNIDYQDLLYRAGSSTRSPGDTGTGSGGNLAPQITAASASRTTGAAPLSITFSGAATDPEGDPLTFKWIFGDGTETSFQSTAAASHVYSANGQFEARLQVTDGLRTTTLEPPIVIRLSNPPDAQIVDPLPGEEFAAGDTVYFSALATDPDETLAESAYTWTILHPDIGSLVGASSGSFQFPGSGQSFFDDTSFEIQVEVRDSAGLTSTDAVTVSAKKANVEFLSRPIDVSLFVNDTEISTPVSVDTAINFEHVLTAPARVCSAGTYYQFVSWSNGQPGSQVFVVPSADITLTADYAVGGPCTGSENQSPLALADIASVVTSGVAAVAVLDNDHDLDGFMSPNTVRVAVPPSSGSTSVDPATGVIRYVHDGSAANSDSFTYTVEDNDGELSNEATVAIYVAEMPPPIFDDPSLLTFNGSNNDVIELPHSPIYEIAQGSLLFAFEAADTNGAQGLFSKDASFSGGGGNHLLVYIDGSTLKARFQNGSTEITENITGIAAGLTYRVAITFGPDGSNVYVNGQLVGTDAFVMDWSDGPNVEYIQWGGRGWASASAQPGFDAPFAGTLADRQIYDVALTDAQIATLHSDGPPNTAPTVANDALVTDEDTPFVITTATLLANDSDDDGDTLTVSRVATDATNGTAVLNTAAGTIVYSPNPNYNGNDNFQVNVADNNGGVSTSTVVVTVRSVNDNPQAVDDVLSTTANTAKTVDVTLNDVDADGDALNVYAVTNGADGVVVVNNDGTITYTPSAGFVGAHSFTYTIGDGNGGAPDTARVDVTVLAAPNTPPVAANDQISVDEDSSVTFQPVDNDLDGDGDAVVASGIVSQPASGSAILNVDRTVTYTPNENFNGADSFEVQVSDGNGGFDRSMVNVTVNPRNDAPVANDDTASTRQATSIIIDTLSNDVDPDGDELSVVALTNGGNGNVSLNPDGTVTYTPDAIFLGEDSFTYTVTDGLNSASALVSVNVTDVQTPLPIFDAPGDVSFDGSNSAVIELPHSPIYEIAAGSILFSFNAVDTIGAQGLFTKDSQFFAGGGNHLLVYLDGSTLKARFQNGSTDIIENITGIAAGLTYQVAITFGADGSHVYINGQLVATDAFVMDWSDGPNVEYIQWGARGWASASGQPGFDAPFAGLIADRQIYDVALSGEEIALINGSDPQVTGGPLPLVVPEVVGMMQADAAAALLDAGLSVGALTQSNSATVPAGRVINQAPAAGVEVAPSSAVGLQVSLGAVQLVVPSVVGMAQADAAAAITGAGLSVGTVTHGNSTVVPSGEVISQTPLFGTPVAPGSAVGMQVSLGQASVIAPAVVGMVEANAETVIVAAGLSLGAVTRVHSATVPAGLVITQTPLAGASVAPGSAIGLAVSLGPDSLQEPADQVEMMFNSIAAQDGWVRESSENGDIGGRILSGGIDSRAIRLGDDRSDRQYKSILSFDTSGLSDNANVVSATIELTRGRTSGQNPLVNHGPCYVDIKRGAFGGNADLASNDFQAPADASAIGVIPSIGGKGSVYAIELSADALAHVNELGTTQMRLYCMLDDNDDGGNDYAGFYSGEYKFDSNRPRLRVTYEESGVSASK